MTQSEYRNTKIAQACNETVNLLIKEKSYSKNNQNAEKIAQYENHLSKLYGMIEK